MCSEIPWKNNMFFWRITKCRNKNQLHFNIQMQFRKFNAILRVSFILNTCTIFFFFFVTLCVPFVLRPMPWILFRRFLSRYKYTGAAIFIFFSLGFICYGYTLTHSHSFARTVRHIHKHIHTSARVLYALNRLCMCYGSESNSLYV